MIYLLQPEQVALFWPAIKHAIVVSNRIPKVRQGPYCNKVLEQALLGKVQCWVGQFEKDGQKYVSAVGTTTIEETSTGVRYLLLHSLFAFRPIPEAHLQELLPALEKFAIEAECSRMTTFMTNERLVEYFKSNGFNQDLTLWSKEV